MSLPREGSRDVGRGIVVSISPDVCLTPVGAAMVPVPYSLVAYQDRSAANMANSVRQTGLVTHVKSSLITQSFGDEPGTGGGVKSGTTGKECEPKTYSSTVFAEGRNVVRHDDEWWMNHKNTVGRLIYTDDMGQYKGPPPSNTRYAMLGRGDPRGASGGKTDGDTGGVQQAFYRAPPTAPYTPPPAPVRPPPPSVPPPTVTVPSGPALTPNAPSVPNLSPAPGGTFTTPNTSLFTDPQTSRIPGIGGAVWQTPLGEVVPLPGDYFRLSPGADGRTLFRLYELERMYRRKKGIPDPPPELRAPPDQAPARDGVRTTGRERRRRCECITGAYSLIRKRCGPECGSTYQAHHIVPDYTLRYGSRPEGIAGVKRIKGLPSYDDGPAICLEGQKADAGSEHGLAHEADAEVWREGSKSAIQGTADIDSITEISVRYANKASKGKCTEKIAEAIAKQPSLDSDILGRTTIAPPNPAWPSDAERIKAFSSGMRATKH